MTPAQRQALATALFAVKVGQHGPAQLNWVKPYLAPLEKQEYIKYSTKHGWELTEKGRKVIHD